MKTIALCLVLVACGKKADEGPRSDPRPESKPEPTAAPDAAVAVLQAIITDAPEATDAATDAGKRTATVDSIIDGTATVTLLRNLVEGEPPVRVTMKLPAGWKQSTTRHDHDVIFVPEGGKYDRPSITLNVQIDNLDPEKVAKELAAAVADKKTRVVGLGKIEVLATRDRPDGKLITRHVDARKERDIDYVETICFVSKPGQKFVVQMLGFVDKGKDDVALTKAYEDACTTVTIVEP